MQAKINIEEPYGDLIVKHLHTSFPKAARLNKSELLDTLTDLIIGTKETRYGCLPTPEHHVHLRQIIKKCIDKDQPIPILVPWGSIKANFSGAVDIAEVNAIKRIVDLDCQIKDFYSPGTDTVIRIEDTSGYSLFVLEADYNTIKENSLTYSHSMVAATAILSNNTIHAQLESLMPNASVFQSYVDRIQPLIEKYLIESHNDSMFGNDLYKFETFQMLELNGWHGIIPWEQRNYYYESYKKLYPNWEIQTAIKRLSIYFAGSWARHTLKMTGAKEEWGKDFIQLSFVPPIKGLPEGYNHNYVYYRTVPLSHARTHIPPWRAKGYLKLTGNDVQCKLTSFNDTELIQNLIPVQATLINEDQKIQTFINTDYLLIS